jgi:hypothetical protein
MQLRDHPLMSYRSIHNWPPAWTPREGSENKPQKGEIGILKEIMLSMIPPRCYLVVEYQFAEYMGCLLFDDRAFCMQIYRLLEDHQGDSIQYIGGLDIGHTF